jgi:hypothetical protein
MESGQAASAAHTHDGILPAFQYSIIPPFHIIE